MSFLKIGPMALACAALLTGCGGGSSSSVTKTAPSISYRCEKNLCQVTAHDITAGEAVWDINGRIFPSSQSLTLFFAKSGTFPISVTDNVTRLVGKQSINVSPLDVAFDDAHTSFQLLLAIDHTIKTQLTFMNQIAPKINSALAASGPPASGTVNCPGGGTLGFSLNGTATTIQPGTSFDISNLMSCKTASGQILEGDSPGATVSTFTYGTYASATNSEIDDSGADISDMEPWYSFFQDFVGYNGTGTMLEIASNPSTGNFQPIFEQFSDLACCSQDPIFTLELDVLGVSLQTDPSDMKAISGQIVWTGTSYLGPYTDRVVTVTTTKPVDIVSDSDGLHMLSGSIDMKIYASRHDYTNGKLWREMKVSIPAGSDTSQLQVSLQDFTAGGATATGTYEQSQVLRLPHNCAKSENPMYCTSTTDFYNNIIGWF